MADVEVFDNVNDLKASYERKPAKSLEEALVRVLDLMDLYISLSDQPPSCSDYGDDIPWVELQWPSHNQK